MPSAARILGVARAFALGAIAGSFFDGFHTHGGMTAYPHPFVFGMAWWTPLVFGTASTLLGLTYAKARDRGRGDGVLDPLPSTAQLGAGFLVFGALYFASGYLPAGHVAKVGVLVAGTALLFAFVDRSRAAVVTALVASFVGPAFEVVLVHLGGFAHLEPDALGIPIWLPALYLSSGPGVAALSFRLMRAESASLPACRTPPTPTPS